MPLEHIRVGSSGRILYAMVKDTENNYTYYGYDEPELGCGEFFHDLVLIEMVNTIKQIIIMNIK